MVGRVKVNVQEIALFMQDQALVSELLESMPDGKKHRSNLLANLFGVSRFTINYIDYILKNGSPELINLINLNKCNEIGVRLLYQFSKLSQTVQKSIISNGGENAIKHCSEQTLHEIEAFINMNIKVDEIVDKNMEEFKTVLGNDTKQICIVANQVEMWCNECKWGFDIFLPNPNRVSCPYCNSVNISKRKTNWNPNKRSE